MHNGDKFVILEDHSKDMALIKEIMHWLTGKMLKLAERVEVLENNAKEEASHE
jgi:hypothetical protein